MDEASAYIDSYFNGELTPDQKKAFERRCLSDAEFATKVARYILVHDQSKARWLQHKKDEFRHFDDDDLQTPFINLNDAQQHVFSELAAETTRKNRREVTQRRRVRLLRLNTFRSIAIAASLLGLIAFGITLFVKERKDKAIVAVNPGNNTKKSKNEADTVIMQGASRNAANAQDSDVQKPPGKITRDQLIAKHFQADAVPPEIAGILAQAFSEYTDRNYRQASREYEEAITTIKDLATRSTTDESEEKERDLLVFYAHYYNSLSYLALGNASKAIAELKAIKVSPDGYWQSKVEWYLALATCKTGNLREGERLLKKIASNPHAGTYKTKAVNLLKDIKSNL